MFGEWHFLLFMHLFAHNQKKSLSVMDYKKRSRQQLIVSLSVLQEMNPAKSWRVKADSRKKMIEPDYWCSILNHLQKQSNTLFSSYLWKEVRLLLRRFLYILTAGQLTQNIPKCYLCWRLAYTWYINALTGWVLTEETYTVV